MKDSKDPFEAAIEESLLQSPVGSEQTETKMTGANTAKIAKMQSILLQFTEDQTRRYEAFRRCTLLHKPNMGTLLNSVIGIKAIDETLNMVVCGIAKMFVGEPVETARLVMVERRESGPIRPCHMRESYRRLKLQGKVPKLSVPRLFR